MRCSTLLAIATACLAFATGAAADDPPIAWPGLPAIGQSAADARGVVFFLESGLAPGAVAVGTAHTLHLADLARSGRVELALPGTLSRAAHSERFAVPPGRPFSLPGATLRGDFVVLVLAEAPRGARVLAADADAELRAGLRVRLPGPERRRGVVDAFGTIVSADPDRIEIDLDLPQHLEGWGGVPVLLAEGDGVVGLVEAAVPGVDATRVLAAPIGGVLEALRRPLDGGAGRPFAAFADAGAPAPEPASPAAPEDGGERGALLQATAGDATQLELSIEYPPDGAEVTSTVCGTFVAGRALATRGLRRRFDVILVIDTSRSTIDASGADVDGDGEVGAPRMGGLGALFGAGLSDPGDSILAAEVAAARQILLGLDPRTTRVGLVAFAGDLMGASSRYAPHRPAFTIEALTRDYRRIERGLDELLATEPEGHTHMAAGVDQATVELLGLRGAYSKPDPDSEKVVFFFTDGQPTLPYPDAEADNVRAVLRAANRAQRGQVRIHSFAIGPEALEGPIAVVEMASRTRGYFTPVRDPGDLVDVVEDVSFANLDEVRLERVGSRKRAEPFRVTADGSWAGFLELERGRNAIRAAARAEDGTTAERVIRVSLAEDGAAEPELPRPLLVQKNRLLEDCLLLARQRRLEQEQSRNDEIRRKLRLEIERERARAQERADEQRKALELEAEEP